MGIGIRHGLRQSIRWSRTKGTRAVRRVFDMLPPVRRAVEDLLRIEVVDRSMVIAAQALLALVPLVVVLAAFLPQEVIDVGVGHLEDVMGLGQASEHVLAQQVKAGAGAGLDINRVRAQTGLLGLVITVLSASSFARAVMRMYERVWELPDIGGLRGRRRSLGWLLAWLAAVEGIAGVGWLLDRIGLTWEPATWPVQAPLGAVVWWWTIHMHLAGRRSWRALTIPALVTGVGTAAYSAGASVVMPRMAGTSVEQFGTLGLVLSVATWLVGFAGVLVVAAVVGRVLAEDVLARWSGYPGSRLEGCPSMAAGVDEDRDVGA